MIQVQHFPTDVEWANTLKTQIEGGTLTFADAARDNSDKDDAVKGGDMGWVGHGQLDPKIEDAIFATPVGKVSDPLKIDGDGAYLFHVTDEQTREPDADAEGRARGLRVLDLVPGAEGRLHDHARLRRSPRRKPRAGRPADARRAHRRGEAPLGARSRGRPAVVVAERLVATPVEPPCRC